MSPAKAALAVLQIPPDRYGTLTTSTIEYMSAVIFLAAYLLSWIGMRDEVTDVVTDASVDRLHSPPPLATTLNIIAKFCNILLVSVIILMVLGLLDLTVVEIMFWRGRQHRVSAFSGTGGGATKMAFSWLFNVGLLIAIVAAMAMTASMCYVVLVRLNVQTSPPTEQEVTHAVTSVLVFNLVAVVVCVILQLLYNAQWDTEGGDAMRAVRDMRGYQATIADVAGRRGT